MTQRELQNEILFKKATIAMYARDITRVTSTKEKNAYKSLIATLEKDVAGLKKISSNLS